MRNLSDCPCDALTCVSGTRGYTATILDEKTGMSLMITSDDTPIVAYLLDGDQWGAATRRPDGVLVVDVGQEDGACVCFIELKGAIDPKEPDRPFDQIEAGVRHFHPDELHEDEGTHGREHHTKWAGGEDLPTAVRRQRREEIRLERGHKVRGIILTSRRGTTVAPRTIDLAGAKVRVVVVQHHGSHGVARLSLNELFHKAGFV